jgi:hypothetical protein
MGGKWLVSFKTAKYVGKFSLVYVLWFLVKGLAEEK